ncbi:MAG: hypothetical protein DLD55_03420 [candidate division SR1 bacterium]|nr:MAG: hypothetical protein DLD55_03420 [candidate division SR1 bacterium]
MRESIFFNREQLKIIRRYSWIYQGFFKYGTWIFSFLLSVLIIWGMVFSGYFSSLSLLKGEVITNGESIVERYQEKQETIAAFSGIQAKILHGQLMLSSSGELLSQNNLLLSSGTIFPNSLAISGKERALLSEKSKAEKVDEEYLHRFFSTFIQKPSKISFFGKKNPDFLTISGSLQEIFGLECLNGATQHSFVCKSYLENFLDHFFFYDLNAKKPLPEGEKSAPLPGTIEELESIYTKIKGKAEYRRNFCQGLLRHGQYGGIIDDRYTEIFRDCGSEYYNQFTLLRDFSTLARAITVGYVDAKIYPDTILNQYKIFSLQQLIYKQMLTSTDTKPLMQSYFSFLREILIKEKNKNKEILNPFTKAFTYRYHTNILAPYLKDEHSKMQKEDRTALTSQLLSINHGDKIANFIGLQEQVNFETNTPQYSKEQTPELLDLEKLFKSSYLPSHFALTKLQKGADNTLVIQGVDKKTELGLEARLKYENIQLLVEKVKVAKKQKLTEYINAIIKNDKLSLNKVLSLMAEHKDIAEQAEALDMRLCSQLKGKYQKSLISCSDTEAKIIFKEEEKEITYHFKLEKGKLKGLKISDSLLESKILKLIDFKQIDASTTFYLITSLVGYTPKEDDNGFGMKEHLLVTEKFVKYFNINPEKVTSEEGEVKVHFSIEELKLIGSYDIINNELHPIAIDFGKNRRPVIVQGLKLIFRDDQTAELNAFLLNPLEYLRNLNPALVKKYFPDKE